MAIRGESQDLDDGPVGLSAGGSDVRSLLEPNVRSTQLAFQHNQRTLEAGVRSVDMSASPLRRMSHPDSRATGSRAAPKQKRPLSRLVRWSR